MWSMHKFFIFQRYNLSVHSCFREKFEVRFLLFDSICAEYSIRVGSGRVGRAINCVDSSYVNC